MNRLEYYRLRADLTQCELADKTGIEQSRLSRAEKGGIDLKGQQWKTIAETLDVSLDDLLGRWGGVNGWRKALWSTYEKKYNNI